jgi:hypothetical protein
MSDVSHIVPDAVFYVRAQQEDTVHRNPLSMEYIEIPQHEIEIPILVVEYVKTNLLVDDGGCRHLDHLLMAMSSASDLYKTLKISVAPVFGLLVDRDEVSLFAATWCDFPVCTSSSQYCSSIIQRLHFR